MTKRIAGKIGRYTFDPHDLFMIGKLKVAFEVGADPDSSDFDPAVPFVHRFMLRGEKPPSGEA